MATKVTVFGQEEPKKELKKIEFVYYIDNDGAKLGPCSTEGWDNICFLGKNGRFDIMLAWVDNSKLKSTYLGHFNDGVVQ